VCPASLLCDADDVLTGVAVVIEPVSAAEVAPIIVQAYDLTDREQQITSLTARGARQGRHRRGAVPVGPYRPPPRQGIFAKVGVNSRGELVARLFADHYGSVRLQDVVRQP
jgi:hypothetical protein